MMKNRKLWLNLLRIALSVLALALLFQKVGGREVWNTLAAADGRLLALAWALGIVGLVVRTFRWRALLAGLGLAPPFGRLLKLYFVGAFFNIFLLSGFGGDVVRVIELAQDEQRAAAFGTVLVDRMTGILSLFLMGLCVLPFTRELAPWLVWTFALISVGGLAGGFLLLEGNLLRRLTERLPTPLSLAGQGPLAQLYAAVSGAGWRAVGMALLLSTVFNLTNVAQYWLCGLAVGLELDFTFYFIAVPLLALTLLVPISVGGLGARDWVAQPLFASVGAADALTAGMSLLVWVATAASGLVGGLVYLWDGVRGLLMGTRRPS
ncbi:MAG TPA: lysylphosphatidylglycerol synthase transmembrane domain-containing protein [Anaerolineae bacterium]|nr:lysylphosphatidylglycerol synthase transmembrane domain-containing protein [Anaerolineae bacterium]